MASVPPPLPNEFAYRHSRRVHAGGSGCAALTCLLLAVFCLLIFWPLSPVFLILACVVDSKYARAHYCGACGNDVAPTSLLCPTCQISLIKGPWRFRSGISAAILTFFLLLAALIWWLTLTR